MKLLHNARIYPLASARPLATALVIDSGRVLAVGGEELLERTGYAERQDMGGRVILPGLTDAHIHLQAYALSRQVVDCIGRSPQEILQSLSVRLEKTPAGTWLRGHGWDQNDWGGEWPHASEPGLSDCQIPACCLGEYCRPAGRRDRGLHA